ncbi:hypothetical protein MANI_118075 [Metarhizium anisopliae]|nr:hypothetical protein MANI_118075 [Metarhizium anisopliae]
MRRVLPQRRPFSPSHPSPTSSSRITNDLQSRPPKLIPDYLSPMPSHLLSTTLSDLLHAPTPSSPTIQSPPEVLPPRPPPGLLPYSNRALKTGPRRRRPRPLPWARVPPPNVGRRREEIGDVRVKGDKGQEKVFVDVWRRYGAKQEWDIEERRTLVFMRNTEGQLASAPRRATTFPHEASWSAKLVPTPTHLFHFSALTFNAHSIHIDPLYARSTDGHRDLLVHGPLTLALMLSVLGGGVQRISYRNHAPLYVNEEMTVCVRKPDNGGGWDVWVEGPEGGLAVRGKAVMDT